MTLSRPFQAIVAALALFVLVWFVVLHRPGGESTSSSSGSSNAQPAGGRAASHGSVSATTAHAQGSTAHDMKASTHHAGTSSASTSAKTGSAVKSSSATGHASGDGGSHAAKHSGGSSDPRSSTSSQAVHSSTGGHTSATTVGKPAGVSHKASPQGTQPAQHGSGEGATSTHAPAMQAAVAAELHQGKVVLLLFWNPRSSDDSAVHRQVQAVAHKLGGRVAVHTAAAGQVGSFGSITRDIQVYQTPTLLIVNPHGQVTTVTGYTDAYSLEQTIREARG
jgi:hypothetical protein